MLNFAKNRRKKEASLSTTPTVNDSLYASN